MCERSHLKYKSNSFKLAEMTKLFYYTWICYRIFRSNNNTNFTVSFLQSTR